MNVCQVPQVLKPLFLVKTTIENTVREKKNGVIGFFTQLANPGLRQYIVLYSIV